MKVTKKIKKLSLKKETIAVLDGVQLREAKGGAAPPTSDFFESFNAECPFGGPGSTGVTNWGMFC